MVRKPYKLTKQPEKWTDEEHEKFLEALKLHGRAWRRIEEHVATKTVVQVRSHAQKFFSKVEKEEWRGNSTRKIDIPPPRPKRRHFKPLIRKSGIIPIDSDVSRVEISETSQELSLGDGCTRGEHAASSTAQEQTNKLAGFDHHRAVCMKLRAADVISKEQFEARRSSVKRLKLFGQILVPAGAATPAVRFEKSSGCVTPGKPERRTIADCNESSDEMESANYLNKSPFRADSSIVKTPCSANLSPRLSLRAPSEYSSYGSLRSESNQAHMNYNEQGFLEKYLDEASNLRRPQCMLTLSLGNHQQGKPAERYAASRITYSRRPYSAAADSICDMLPKVSQQPQFSVLKSPQTLRYGGRHPKSSHPNTRNSESSARIAGLLRLLCCKSASSMSRAEELFQGLIASRTHAASPVIGGDTVPDATLPGHDRQD
ncbi:hypothetical protein O6H91_02G052900 [Diphasiastrum complanatum]|uniref:Uncharacterized protein n=1 Tax=Diphasiastrum complanatum TaxID=34168 RepID=A0ACC2EFD8_DIPCM|nr:hypothetical protein O6H91_02G052900 [Diphasiastrum complanatum]